MSRPDVPRHVAPPNEAENKVSCKFESLTVASDLNQTSFFIKEDCKTVVFALKIEIVIPTVLPKPQCKPADSPYWSLYISCSTSAENFFLLKLTLFMFGDQFLNSDDQIKALLLQRDADHWGFKG